MSTIYGQSTIYIAAADAKDGSAGCFFERDLRTVKQVLVRLTVQGRQSVHAYYRSPLYESCVLSTVLAKRAWALQERVLSTRTLKYKFRMDANTHTHVKHFQSEY
jgi:hypothetical protein